MTTIYLVRHGQASFGAQSYDQLSAIGEQQAVVLGRFLKHILKTEPVVVAGSMQRHQQTARIALAGSFPEVAITTQHGWNEFNHQQVFALYEPRFSEPELLRQDVAKEVNPRAYLAKIFEGAIDRWVSEEYDYEYEESWHAFQQRVDNAFDQLCQDLRVSKPRYAVVFSSGGVISVVAGKLLGLQPKQIFALNWSIANSSLTSIRLHEDQVQLLSFNEHHFIKAEHADLLTWI